MQYSVESTLLTVQLVHGGGSTNRYSIHDHLTISLRDQVIYTISQICKSALVPLYN